MDHESRIMAMIARIEDPTTLKKVYCAVKKLIERERRRTGREKKEPVEVCANEETD